MGAFLHGKSTLHTVEKFQLSVLVYDSTPYIFLHYILYILKTNYPIYPTDTNAYSSVVHRINRPAFIVFDNVLNALWCFVPPYVLGFL